MSTITLPQTERLTGAAAESATRGMSPRRQLSAGQRAEVREAAALMASAFGGDRRAMLTLQENMTRSDFQHTFGNTLDAELMRQYEDISPIWPGFARRTTVPNFKPKRFVDLLGGRGELDRVAEREEYKARSLTDAAYEFVVVKYGNRISVTFEMFIDDDLDALRDAPNRLAQAARDTEDINATRLLTGAAGPNSDFFNAGNENLITGNPALSEESVEAALTQISTRRDSEGRPIFVRAAVLVVPPELQTAAERIVGATEVRETIGGRTIVRTNPMAGRVRVIVNPWLTVVDESANADSTWYLLPDPNTPRPAVVMGFLRGYEQPDLRVKNDQGQRLNGGPIDPTDGSFDIDDVQYRVRHIMGGTGLDPITTAVSTGAGS